MPSIFVYLETICQGGIEPADGPEFPGEDEGPDLEVSEQNWAFAVPSGGRVGWVWVGSLEAGVSPGITGWLKSAGTPESVVGMVGSRGRQRPVPSCLSALWV